MAPSLLDVECSWLPSNSGSMRRHEVDGTLYYTFRLLEQWPGLTQAVFTRVGGVSRPPFDGLNASTAVGDEPAHVAENHRRIAAALGWDQSRIATVRQVHGTDVLEAVAGNLSAARLQQGDALVTAQSGIVLMMRFADCTPLILWDPAKRVVGLVHAGWKGTITGAPAATVEHMASRHGSSPGDIFVGIGPSIGPCCYQVGDTVVQPASRAFPNSGVLQEWGDGSMHFDLWGANAESLMRAGVPEENIAVAGLCTSCHPDLFFSHRASKGNTGRFAVMVGMRDE